MDKAKELPLIITKDVRGAKIIYSLNSSALKLGLRVSQSLVHARAICPDILVFDANEKEYAEALNNLALWAINYSPHVSTRIMGGHFALIIDITGCAHLFGGEDAMKAHVLHSLQSFGIQARGAIAASLGAAWALAFYGNHERQAGQISTQGDRYSKADIDILPIKALRLDNDTNERLNTLGIKTIGQLAKIPPKPLARRFGSEVLRYLSYARDGVQEPINPIREITPLAINHRLEHALLTMEGIEARLEFIVIDICALLDSQNKGARILRVCFYRLDGVVFEIRAISANAHSYFDVWYRLLKQRLEQKADNFDFGFGIDVINAYAELAEDKKPEAIDLDPLTAAAIKSANAVHRLAERLSARIGAKQVCRIYTHENWVPERAQSYAPVLSNRSNNAAKFSESISMRRPPLMFQTPKQIEAIAEVPDGPPKQFNFRGLRFKVKNSTAPERIIEPLLGSKKMPINSFRARDYYQVHTETGARFFIYRIGNYGAHVPPKWFVHGVG